MSHQLSKDQMDDLTELFCMFDKNGDGTIGNHELGRIMRALGLNPTEGELKHLIEETDVDGNGFIKFNEFVTLMVGQLTESDVDEEMRADFLLFDKDGNGIVSADELQEVLSSIDGNGDGRLNYEEFEFMMLGNSNDPTKLEIGDFKYANQKCALNN